jgi:MFS family permease
MLRKIYPDAYTKSSAQANVASITFAGTVVGMLFFGYTSDHFSRKWSLFASTIIIIVFATLGTGSYGAGGSPTGLLAALVAFRFFLGIGKYLPQQCIWYEGSLQQALEVSTQQAVLAVPNRLANSKKGRETNGSSSSQTSKLISPFSSRLLSPRLWS